MLFIYNNICITNIFCYVDEKVIVERAIFDQLTDFFNFHFHPSLSAFRKGFGCQTALLKIIEDWKKALDENK
jgi:hypothetical protein